MKEIPLQHGMVAVIDDEDFDLASTRKWYAIKPCHSSGWMVCSHQRGLPFLYLHRFILDAPRGMYVDHINHDTLDNRRCNLRLCTKQQNQCNQSHHKDSKSPYKGVHRHKRGKKWYASLYFKG